MDSETTFPALLEQTQEKSPLRFPRIIEILVWVRSALPSAKPNIPYDMTLKEGGN